MLIFTLISHLFIQPAISCPSFCSCERDVVDCSDNLLDEIPHDIPVSTQVLNVTGNRLKYLDDRSFHGLFNLQELYLQSNKITVIYEHTFRTNRKLKFLNLRNNNIRELPEDLFMTNSQLKQIDLRDNNRLTYIPYPLVEHLRHFHSLKANNIDCGCDMIEWYRNMPLLSDKGLFIDITCATPKVNIQTILNHMIRICSSNIGDQTCNIGEAMCDDGKCISDDLWCDGNFDCYDRSDELSCTTDPPLERCETMENHFLCNDGKLCLPKAWVCDGFPDCGDSSDEKNSGCASHARTCPAKEYQCTNNRCIPAMAKCDGSNDCGDWSDESKLTCGEKEAVDVCPAGMALCPFGGGCIDYIKLCDGVPDCPHGTDERDCFGNCTTFCSSDRRCIKETWICDGVPDCTDYSDEINCEYTCEEEELKCGGCLGCQFICDGVRDCYDGIDEHGCAICNSSICLGSPQMILIIVCVVSACFLIGSTSLFFFLYRRRKCSRGGGSESSETGEGSVRGDGPPQYTEIDNDFLPHSPPPRYKSEPDITTRIVGTAPPMEAEGLYPQHFQDI